MTRFVRYFWEECSGEAGEGVAVHRVDLAVSVVDHPEVEDHLEVGKFFYALYTRLTYGSLACLHGVG